MKRALLIFGAAIALISGIASGEYLTDNFSFRRRIGTVVRRGGLLRLVNRHGIYESDVERTWRATLFADGAEPTDVEQSAAGKQKGAVLERLIAAETLSAAASQQPLSRVRINREFDLLRWQFGEERAWRRALRNAAASSSALRREITTHLRDRTWIESQIAGSLGPNDDDCRRYYTAHRAIFQQPPRFRASHLFLAAPDGYPGEVIEAKRALIETLSVRLREGESFPALVAEFSEDEATKKRGGDLHWFTEERMLPALFAAAQQLHPGETSAPIRSPLGFHLLRLIAVLPVQELTFAQARPAIVATLENEKRATALESLIAAVGGKSKIAVQRNQFDFVPAESPNETATINGTN